MSVWTEETSAKFENKYTAMVAENKKANGDNGALSKQQLAKLGGEFEVTEHAARQKAVAGKYYVKPEKVTAGKAGAGRVSRDMLAERIGTTLDVDCSSFATANKAQLEAVLKAVNEQAAIIDAYENGEEAE